MQAECYLSQRYLYLNYSQSVEGGISGITNQILSTLTLYLQDNLQYQYKAKNVLKMAATHSVCTSVHKQIRNRHEK